ncbi:Conserved_hypothetical protein [Hexamita inflata]|uniref:Uncharacterized protein n=1 Tax=Hexamita inflata TaxID=28002 RepID=A0ABP1GV06_9EUKA
MSFQSKLSTFEPLSHYNTRIPAFQPSIPYPRSSINDRLSMKTSQRFKTRSCYGQAWADTNPHRKIDEQHELIQLVRCGNKSKFQRLQKECTDDCSISQMMQSMFILGKAFDSKYIIQNQLYSRDISGKTALHYAVAGGCDLESPSIKQRITKYLIKSQDNNGITSLMMAAELGEFSACLALKEESTMQDVKGRTALMHALQNKQLKVAQYLFKVEAAISDNDNNNWEWYSNQSGIIDAFQKMLTNK